MDLPFWYFLAVGFAAQLVDGALGMAYGLISTTFLLSFGLSPASASASVHAAEVFTTGASGLSHLYHRNVERRVFLQLALPGCLGAVVGAYFLTRIPGDIMRPFIALYLIVMAGVIARRALVKSATRPARRNAAPLGFIGALLDAVGGGGWGPIVTSTLIARGSTPRYVVGSVCLAEFFVTISASATFVLSIGLEYGTVVLGLLIGGVVAAPMAGYLTKRLPARWIMVLVALVITGLSIYMLWASVSFIRS